MSDCCSSTNCSISNPQKRRCPVNGNECRSVSSKTIAHHIAQPWAWDGKREAYYFCDDPDCDVVYFSDDDIVITKSRLRTEVGVKSTSEDSLTCYCFGVTKSQASNPDIKQYVIEQTKQGTCSCDSANPSGKCCLKDFPKTK